MSFASQRPLIRTLRARLTIWHLSILAVALVLFALLSYQALSRNLYRHHDEELLRQAEELSGTLARGSLDDGSVQRALQMSQVGSRLVMIRNSRGELVYREPILDSTEPNVGRHTALVHAAAAGVRSPQFFTVSLERSGETRFICVPLQQSNAYLQIGDPLGDVRETLRATALAWLPLIPAVLGLSSFGGWLIARRALRPMRTIGATLRQIHATDLSRRVQVHPADEELEELAATLNHLLDRLQRGFASLEQFAGDVSHQVQTPLTVMKSALESARRGPEAPTGYAELLHSLSEEVDQMSTVVNSLREFALADAPVHSAGPIDLSHLVEEVVDIVSALGELRDVEVRRTVQRDVMVQGDSVRLKQVVLNLGDNAVKYTPKGGRVDIQLQATHAEAVVQVTDSGLGIPQEHLPRLFDRLYRADAADVAGTGTGLGLAIVKRILDAHRGTISVESRVGHGSTFTVRLPRL